MSTVVIPDLEEVYPFGADAIDQAVFLGNPPRPDVVLFLDEADALLGGRSGVGSGNDRYANLEATYLLQRIEAYGGVVILATNRRKPLDPKWVARVRYVVPVPGG